MLNAYHRSALALLVPALAVTSITAAAQGAQRVFTVVADSVPLSVSAAASAISDAFVKQGWTVLADHTVATDASRCTYTAHVIVAQIPAHTASLIGRGATAPYAIPVRVGVFEDEFGVHVDMVNPLSVERTIVEETGLEASGRALIDDITGVVVGATHGRRVRRAFGQERDRGLIGKTMGVMAGGPFAGQIETISVVPVASTAGTSALTGGTNSAADLRRVSDAIWQRLQQPPRGKWQLKGVYRLDLAEQGVIILGVSGGAMETRAFGIVGAGDDDARADCKCPGSAYAAAFPLEVVIQRDGGQIKVGMIAAMFRMKMYFEDAGRMKFARNMGMPGSIADELKELVTLASR